MPDIAPKTPCAATTPDELSSTDAGSFSGVAGSSGSPRLLSTMMSGMSSSVNVVSSSLSVISLFSLLSTCDAAPFVVVLVVACVVAFDDEPRRARAMEVLDVDALP